MADLDPFMDKLGDSAHDRILHTAHALFYAHGIRATGIDRVIAEAGVTKVTFYRHFPSKHALILAYLTLRHERWMAWFNAALQRHGPGVKALVPALGEWLRSRSFRGCAFLNAVGEMAEELPEVLTLTQQHKADMAAAIAGLLPPSRQRKAMADALAMAVDGAIVQVQSTTEVQGALNSLQLMIKALAAPQRN